MCSQPTRDGTPGWGLYVTKHLTVKKLASNQMSEGALDCVGLSWLRIRTTIMNLWVP
jgi:hypothetical protein